MIDPIGVSVSHSRTSRDFYVKALAPLNYELLKEFPGSGQGEPEVAGFGERPHPDFWLGVGPVPARVHVAIRLNHVSRWMLFIRQRWRPVAGIMASRVSGLSITQIIMEPLCWIQMGIKSKRFAIIRHDGVNAVQDHPRTCFAQTFHSARRQALAAKSLFIRGVGRQFLATSGI